MIQMYWGRKNRVKNRTNFGKQIAVNCQIFDDLILKTFEGILACGFSSQGIMHLLGTFHLFFLSKSLAQSFLQTPIFKPYIESCLSSLNCSLPEEDREEFSSERLQQKNSVCQNR